MCPGTDAGIDSKHRMNTPSTPSDASPRPESSDSTLPDSTLPDSILPDSQPAGGQRSAGVGRLIILSGPSGAGKSTVTRRLIRDCPLPLVLSVSATTRPPRPGERDGKDYFFLQDDDFQQRRQSGEFLECKEVFGRGHWYGTLREQVASGLNAGRWVILEIDVQGALAVMREASLDPISIFIHPGGMDALAERLRGRGTETEDAILRRLEVAATELSQVHHYDHEIINDKVDLAVDEICQILQTKTKPPSDKKRACSKN